MLAIRAYLLVDVSGQRGGYARLNSPGSRDATGAIDAALAALVSEPLRETAHRALIEAHLAEGNRAEAERDWRAYRRLIRQRFRAEPAFSWQELASAPPALTHV
jgi:hypothetical protein